MFRHAERPNGSRRVPNCLSTGSFSAHHTAVRVGFFNSGVSSSGDRNPSSPCKSDAMDDREESRQEWEKEIREIQQGVMPAQGLRRAQIIAKRASASPAPIPDFAHFVRFLLSAALLVIGFLVFSSDIPHKTTLGAAVLVAGGCLAVAAVRWPRKRG